MKKIFLLNVLFFLTFAFFLSAKEKNKNFTKSINSEITISVENLDFGIVKVGETKSLTAIISSTSATDIIIESIEVNAPFSCDYSGTISLGELVTININFSPIAVGEHISELKVLPFADGDPIINLNGFSYAENYLYQDFEDYGFPYDGWNLNGEIANWSRTYSYVDDGYNLNLYSGFNFDIDISSEFITPKLAITNTDSITFEARVTNSDENSPHINVKYATEIGGTYTLLNTFYLLEDYQTFKVDFSEIEEGNYYIIFEGVMNTSNYLDIYLDNITMPEYVYDEVPESTTYIIPENEETNTSITEINFSWNSVFSAFAYKFYLGTNENPEITDFVDLENETSYLSSEILEYSTTYYWSVIPNNENGDAENCPIFSFTTMDDPTLIPPILEEFSSVPPTNWTLKQGLLTENTQLSEMNYSTWTSDGFLNDGYSGAARINIYGTNKNDWIISPPIDLENNGNYRIEFDLGLISNNNETDFFSEDDKFALIISTDNGQTWNQNNVIRMWDNEDEISNEGENIVINITEYTGVVKVAFYVESTINNSNLDLFVDNFRVREIPATPVLKVLNDSINFENLTINEIAIPKVAAFKNNGIGTLIIDSVVLESENEFSLLENENVFPVNLITEEEAYTTIYFQPITDGLKTADLIIYSDYGNDTVKLYGTGIDPVLYPDTLVTFDEFPLDNWQLKNGILNDPMIFEENLTSPYWVADGFANEGYSGSMKLNIWGTNCKAWAISPTIDLGDGNTIYNLEFDLALTHFANTNQDELGADDNLILFISTDNGETWNPNSALKSWGSQTQISNTGEHHSINLSEYTGNVKVAFYGESTLSNEDNDIFIDNFEIKEASLEPIISVNMNEINFNLIENGNSDTLEITISNNGVSELVIGEINLDAPFYCNTETFILQSFQDTIIEIIFLPSEAGNFSSDLSFVSNAENSVNVILNASAFQEGLVLQDFENTEFPPAGWAMTSGWTRNIYTTHIYEGSGSARVEGDNESWLFSPKLQISEGDMLTFYYKAENVNYPSGLEIRMASGNSSQTDTNSYTETLEILNIDNVENTEWLQATYTFENLNSDKFYLAFHRNWQTATNWFLYIDNVFHPAIVENEAPDQATNPSPENNNTNVNIDLEELSWNSPLNTTSYKVYFGTNENPNSEDFIDTESNITSFSLSDEILEYSTTYYWSVIPINEIGDAENCPIWSFTTVDDPILIPNLIEDFENPSFAPINWTKSAGFLADEVIFTSNNYSGWIADDFANISENSTSAKLNIYGTSKKDWLITPPINIGNGDTSTYILEFDLALTEFSNANSSAFDEDDKFAVLISTDNGETWSQNNVLRMWTNDDEISNESEHIIIDISQYSGIVKFAFYGESTVSGADNDIFVDNFEVKKVNCENFSVELGENQEYCFGTNLNYLISVENNFQTYVWSENGNILDDTDNEIDGITEIGTHIYSLNVTNEFNCEATDEIQITINELPTLDLGDEQTHCAGTEYNISVENNFQTYVWYEDGNVLSETTNEINGNNQAGNYIYSLIVTDENNCQADDDINILINESPDLELGENQEFCQAEQAYILNVSNSFETYEWSENETILEDTDNEININSETGTYTYSLTVTNEFCSKTDELQITINENPILDLGDDILDYEGENIELNANPENDNSIISYLWNDNSTEQTLNINENGTYSVTVTNENSCEANDEIIITFDVGISEINKNNIFEIFPNPAKNEVNFIIKNEIIFKNCNISIIDLQGKILFNENIEKNIYKKQIDISNFEKGVYFIKFNYDNNFEYKKFIVIK